MLSTVLDPHPLRQRRRTLAWPVAYGEKGAFICDGEWSAPYALNRQAAEILRNKGDDRGVIVDQSRAAGV